jgi:hypothetical protein
MIPAFISVAIAMRPLGGRSHNDALADDEGRDDQLPDCFNSAIACCCPFSLA